MNFTVSKMDKINENGQSLILGKNRNYFCEMRNNNNERYLYIKSLNKSLVVGYRLFEAEYETIKEFLASKHLENEDLFRQVAKNTGVFRQNWARQFIEPLFRETLQVSWTAFKKRKAMYKYYKRTTNE